MRVLYLTQRKVMELDFLNASLFKCWGHELWKHSPVDLDLKYAQQLSKGQGQISGR